MVVCTCNSDSFIVNEKIIIYLTNLSLIQMHSDMFSHWHPQLGNFQRFPLVIMTLWGHTCSIHLQDIRWIKCDSKHFINVFCSLPQITGWCQRMTESSTRRSLIWQTLILMGWLEEVRWRISSWTLGCLRASWHTYGEIKQWNAVVFLSKVTHSLFKTMLELAKWTFCVLPLVQKQ